MPVANTKSNLDQRINPRRSYSGNIFYITKKGLSEGRLKNFSRYGLFIETSGCVSVGEIITVALPHLDGKDIKCKGQIIWRNRQGCGVELFRKRTNTNFRIIK